MSEPVSANNIKELLLSVFEKYNDYLVFAYLFGSAVKDNYTHLSDIDIAVFLSKGKEKLFSDTKLSLHTDFCRALKRDNIDLVLLNTAKNIILLDRIVNDGIVLFDSDRDFRKEFEQKILHRAIDFKDQRMALMHV